MIKRGDIYYAVLVSKKNSSLQSGRRPVLVVSNNANNVLSGNVNVVPLTGKIKNDLPVHVEIEGYGLKKRSVALVEQITTIEKNRIESDKLIGHVDKETLKKVVEAIIRQMS